MNNYNTTTISECSHGSCSSWKKSKFHIQHTNIITIDRQSTIWWANHMVCSFIWMTPLGIEWITNSLQVIWLDALYTCKLDSVSFHKYIQKYLSSECINNKKNAYVQRVSGHEFSVAHYTGKVTYDCREMADKSRDFLPPEMVGIFDIVRSVFFFSRDANLKTIT